MIIVGLGILTSFAISLYKGAVRACLGQLVKGLGYLACGVGPFAAWLLLIRTWFCHQDWCRPDDLLPNGYSYLQARFWDVGLFSYWQLKNITMLLWALPSYAVTVYSLTLELPDRRGLLAGLKLKTALFLGVSVTMAHFQSYTRFVSSNPLWLAALASMPGWLARLMLVTYNVSGLVFFSNGYVWT